MKLQEFFDTQKHINLSDIDKLDLYQNILYKKTKKTALKRVSFFYTKNIAYSMIVGILLFGVYGVYFINNGNLEDYNRFSIIKSSTNIAQADYIAQVIDVKGNFFIEHDGILRQTNNISNGDTILLKENTQLAFEIASGGTQSKIIGPAKLIVQQTNNQHYKLNLVYGDFIQMEGNTENKQTIELAINDIIIKQEDKSQPLNFKFIKEGNKQIFQNNGANIIVTKNNNTEKATTISKAQVVAIQNNDIKIFANIDSFTKAIQAKNVSQTFTITDKDPTKDQETKDQETISLLSLLTANGSTSETTEEVTKEITSVLGDEKKILDISQDKELNSTLFSDFYLSEIKEIQNAFLNGDTTTFLNTYTKLEKRIQNVYNICNINYPKQSGEPKEKINGLMVNIKKIQEIIENEYNIPPQYSKNLQDIYKHLQEILNQTYGSNSPQEISTDEKE